MIVIRYGEPMRSVASNDTTDKSFAFVVPGFYEIRRPSGHCLTLIFIRSDLPGQIGHRLISVFIAIDMASVQLDCVDLVCV